MHTFTLHLGGSNRTGILPDLTIKLFCASLHRAGAEPLSYRRKAWPYRGRIEQSAEIICQEASDFAPVFGAIQAFRKKWRQTAIGMSNPRGVYLRITGNTHYCSGFTAMLRCDSIRPRPGHRFDPAREGFRQYGQVLVSTTPALAWDGFASRHQAYLPYRLLQDLQSFDLYRIVPADATTSIRCPDWLAGAFRLSREEHLIWLEAPEDGIPPIGTLR